MDYGSLRIPLSRERKMRAYWARSFTVRTAVDRDLAVSHPNPDRAGCPGLWLLANGAIGRLAEGHPTYDHFRECSPCYREMRGIQQTKQPRNLAVVSYYTRHAARALRLYAYRRLRLWRDAASRRLTERQRRLDVAVGKITAPAGDVRVDGAAYADLTRVE